MWVRSQRLLRRTKEEAVLSHIIDLAYGRSECSLLPGALTLCEFGEPSQMEPGKEQLAGRFPRVYGILSGLG